MQVIELPPGTRIWLAAGVTDRRRGFQGLSAQVQTVLPPQRRRPVAGDPRCSSSNLTPGTSSSFAADEATS